MDFVKQQISSAVKNASSNTANNSDPTNIKNDKDNNNGNAGGPKSVTPATAQGGPQQAQDLAKTISQDLANLRALGDNGNGSSGSGSGKNTNTYGLLPVDLSDEQLSQLGSHIGAAVAAERAENPDKSAEATGADTLKRMRDLESQGGDVAAALQGGVHQMAEKEAVEGAVEQGRMFLTQQQQEGGQERGSTDPTTTSPAATTTPTTASKPPVTRSKAAATLGEPQSGKGVVGGYSTTDFS
ncbi:hypothetical protein PG989_009291 [Apiospora arundinis]